MVHPGNAGRYATTACFVYTCLYAASLGGYVNALVPLFPSENSTSKVKFAQPILITVAWFFMFYTFLFHQSYTHNCAYIGLVAKAKKDGKREIIDNMKLKAGT